MMGCGVSSASQISPISAELPYNFKNGASQSHNCSSANSTRPWSAHSTTVASSPINSATRFNLGFLFPCKFYSTTSPSTANLNSARKQCCSTHVQTDSDILGFKCQHSQTDSTILSDEELEAMIEELEKELKNVLEEGKESKLTNGNSNSDIEDEIELGHKSWKGIIKAHQANQLDHSVKRFANIAIQATRPTATSATQTKFGSIDHQFVPNPHAALFSRSPQHFLDHNELLTKTISENLLKVIEQPLVLSTSLDEHLSTLLTSFDDEDDPTSPHLPEGDTADKMVNSIQKTLADYDSESRRHSEEKPLANNTSTSINNISSNNNSSSSPTHSHPNEIPEEKSSETVNPTDVVKPLNNRPGLWDARKKLKDAQKRIKLLKQQKFQDCLELILDDIRNKKSIEDLLPGAAPVVKKRDVSLQTTNDILTDEAPHFAARPPLCSKIEMIPSVLMFREIDRKMQEASELNSVAEIGQFVCKHAKNDLFKIRALFVWVTSNIKFNNELNARQNNMVSAEIIQQREGTSKDYCQLFSDLCRAVDIRVKTIEGFARGYDYRPGYHFSPGQDPIWSWNAVFVLSSWRFIDLTLAAGYTDASGVFHHSLNEFYFLTDPNLMIWTHFPYNELESNYERWQLLDKPLTLEQFNAAPKVTEWFFEYNLSIRSRVQSPLQFRISTEIKLGSHEAMRYKYKFYPADEVENSSLNHYVFCQLKEDRLVGSFMVSPPLEGRFMLKVFAKPEREMYGSQQDISASLSPVVTMLLECTKARKYIEPLPISELPWGPTQKFFDYKLKLVNQKGPTIVTWGGRRRLVLEANETMLISYSLFDSESMEMDARSMVSREDVALRTTFTINPPRVGCFKFLVFGCPKPKTKGKVRLPLLATFMIDCKLIKPPQHDEDAMIPASNASSSEESKNEGKNKKNGKK